MLGRRRIAIKFRIYKSISGIARSRYNNPDNILESKDNIEIAKLRRLADNHAEEIDDTIPFEPMSDCPYANREGRRLQGNQRLEDLPWMVMKKRVQDLGHETFSITKIECLEILRDAESTTPEDDDESEEDTGSES